MIDMDLSPELLREKIRALEKERDHWKANHDHQVQKARLLFERLDLPVDRVAAFQFVTEVAERLRQRDRLPALNWSTILEPFSKDTNLTHSKERIEKLSNEVEWIILLFKRVIEAASTVDPVFKTLLPLVDKIGPQPDFKYLRSLQSVISQIEILLGS